MGIILDMILFLSYEALSGLIPLFLVFMIVHKAQKRNKAAFSRYHFLAVLIFTLYIIGVFYFTGVGTLYDGLKYQLELRQDQINFIPFSHDIDITDYLLNIVLFIPFGLLTPVIWTKMNKLTNILGAGFLFTILIEVSQLLNNRATDIDDVILNLFGAVIGFGLYKTLDRYTRFKLQTDSPFVYELPICIIAAFLGRFLLYDEMGLAKLLYRF